MASEVVQYRELPPSFVLGLVLRLRERGLLVSPVDAAQAVRLIEGKTFTADDLTKLLGAQFVRRETDTGIFEDELNYLLRTQPPPPTAAPAKPPQAEPLVPRLPPTVELSGRPEPGLVRRALAVAKGLFARVLAAIAAVHYGYLMGALGVLAALLWWRSCNNRLMNVCDLMAEGGIRQDNAFSLVSALAAPLIAIVSIPIAIWARRVVLKDDKEERAETDDPQLGRATPKPNDGTYFKVAVLGGQPNPMLSATRRVRIAEVIGYRTGSESAGIDLGKTIDAVVRGGDPAELHPALRRELPVIVLLVDQAAPARYCNSLAREFEELLKARGIGCEVIGYNLSFHGRDGRLLSAAREIEQRLAAPGWTVLCVFGEVHRLSHRDQRFLARATENGPVLVLDYRDPVLWDKRHMAFEAIHIDIVLRPASAQGLEQGLAKIFAAGRSPPTALAAAADPDNLRPWFEECALLEPMSYALADHLRRRHAASDHSNLPFSLIAGRAGAWLGPEGLRFSPKLRSELVASFRQRPETDRRAALAIIDKAFEEATVEDGATTAQAIKAYAQAQARYFAFEEDDEALETLLDAEHEGHVDSSAVQDFRMRLKAGEAASLPGAIPLSQMPGRARHREILSGTMGLKDGAAQSYNAARWRIGAPQVRIGKDERDSRLPAAAFLSGTQFLLVAGLGEERRSILRLIHSTRGYETRLDLPSNGGQVTRLWAARDAAVAAAALDDGTLLWLYSATDATNETPALQSQPVQMSNESGADFAAALDVAGNRFVYSSERRPGGAVLVDRTGGSRQLDDLAAGHITAFAWLEENTLLIGDEGGGVHRVEISGEGSPARRQQLARCDSPPLAILGLREDQAVTGVAVALSSGRIELHPIGSSDLTASNQGLPSSTRPNILSYRLRAKTIRLAFLADSPAASVWGRDGPADTGHSLAVQLESGVLEVIGFPPIAGRTDGSGSPAFAPMALSARHPVTHGAQACVIAFSGANRRVAAWRNSGRLEIRPLLYDRPEPYEQPPPSFAGADTSDGSDMPR